MAKTLALAHRLPLVGVNHLEGHVYANWLLENERGSQSSPPFPACASSSRGATRDLVLMEGHGQYTASWAGLGTMRRARPSIR